MCVSERTITSSSNWLPCRAVTLPLLLLLLLLCCIEQIQCLAKGDMAAAAASELAALQPALELKVSDSDFERLVEARLNESTRQQLLSRKRRYLVFPEGSSFQVVYDEIVGVVDHTNYLILGITVALAWELPSKPPSEILEDLKTKLDEGTLDISRNDTAANLTYVDDVKQNSTNSDTGYKPNYINLAPSAGSNAYYSKAPAFRVPMHPVHQYADSYYRQPASQLGWRRKDSHYYAYRKPGSSSRNPFQQWTKPFSQVAAHQKSRYPYWSLHTRLRDTLRQRNHYYSNAGVSSQQHAPPTAQRRQGYAAETSTTTTTPAPRHHRIYPVFGKRSIPDAAQLQHHRQRRSGVANVHDTELSKFDRIQIKHHRSSRQLLYERIQKYLDKRGLHGQHCVLRALCETGQKSHEQEPNTFVGELMRTIFTMPEPLEKEPVAYQDTRYDQAHAHSGDCAKLYPQCKQSMWMADFIQ